MEKDFFCWLTPLGNLLMAETPRTRTNVVIDHATGVSNEKAKHLDLHDKLDYGNGKLPNQQ